MTGAVILWIDGKRAGSSSFVPGLLGKGYKVETVTTGKAALEKLITLYPDIAVVNAASMRSSGTRICHSIRSNMDGLPIILINDPEHTPPKDVDANVVLTLPFTIRKLVNRIIPLVPGGGKKVVAAGPIRLDLELLRIRCEGREAKVTPRTAQLLRELMGRAGEVVERKGLFSKVWKTDYTVDTRTLDVHISWLRQAIEENPRKPQFLKTIRGVGYRLDV